MHLAKALPNAKPRAIALGGGIGAQIGATATFYGSALGGVSWLACVNANISLVHTATFHFHSELHTSSFHELWSAS